jgi:hypothetical protein
MRRWPDERQAWQCRLEGQGGGKADGSCNRFENALSVGHDIVIVEAQNTKAFVGEISISTSVALLLS